MNDKLFYTDKFNERRVFFQINFPLNVGRQRKDIDVKSLLKNSCPVCGYLTLDKRDSFEICGICFWEDDGLDEYNVNENSGPNRMKLVEGRLIFQEAKRKLFISSFNNNVLIDTLKNDFNTLDNLIEQSDFNKSEIILQQNKILDFLEKHRIYGIENLF